MNVYGRINIYWIAPLLYMVLIFYLSSSPLPIKIPTFSLFDKVMHVLEYAILSAFIYLALRKSSLTRYQLLGLVFAISFLYGISDEIHQYFIPGREADLFDVMANGIGAFGCSLALYLKPHWQNK
jgi:VanZ family protein